MEETTGGVESLIEHRASMEGEGTPCPPDVLRLSVGLEDPHDLYDDLDAALQAGALATTVRHTPACTADQTRK